MTDREFDKLIRKMMQEYRVADDPASWEHLADRLDVEAGDMAFDDTVKTALTGITASGAGDWTRMERDLIAEERTFDNAVKEKVETYEAPYDPASWPALHEKVAENEKLRRRLVTAKVLEIAAILIAFLTFYNFFPEIEELIQSQDDPAHTSQSLQELSMNEEHDAATINAGETPASQFGNAGITVSERPVHETATLSSSTEVNSQKQVAETANQKVRERFEATPADISPVTALSAPGVLATKERVAGLLQEAQDHASGLLALNDRSDVLIHTSDMTMPKQIASIHPAVSGFDRVVGVSMATVAGMGQNGMRVGIGASVDLNMLDMPDDIFYSQGRQIKFSAKELSTIGYTAGASVLFDKGPVTFETGLYYSLKQYEPNRVLHIGETFDVRTLDFQRIDLNVVSIPMLLHWNFDQKGKVRWYATGGMNMHIIAVAHYDLIVKNSFSSSAAPPDPQFQRNSQEVARVREHILDGAEFSSKSYLALSAGFGVERRINHRFSIFGQPTFNYQIPFFGISDQNGKDLQFASILLGTRIKLK